MVMHVHSLIDQSSEGFIRHGQEANCVLSGRTHSPGDDSRSRDQQPTVSKTSNEPSSFIKLP